MTVHLAGGMILLLAGGILLASTPYDSITQRNPFALVAPPPPVDESSTPPPSNIKLTGVSNFGGLKKAMFMVQDTSVPGKPGQSVILREGQREGQIEVVQINEKLGSVKLRKGGGEVTLTFEADGIKNASAPASAQPALGQMTPSGRVIRSGSANPNTDDSGARGGLRQIPTRTLRYPRSGSSSAPAGQTAVPGGQPQTPQLTAEEQLILMHAQQIIDQPRVDAGEIPPTPPLPPLPEE